MLNTLLVVSGVILVILGGAGLAQSDGAGFHSYTLTVTGNGTTEPLVVTKSGEYAGKFEVDQNYVTTFTVVNSASVSIDLEVGEYGTCHIRFQPPGASLCRSQVATIPQGGAPVNLIATGALGPFDLSYHGPSEVRVAVTGQPLQTSDPDLEVDRDIFLVGMLALLAGMVSLWAWWRRRRTASKY